MTLKCEQKLKFVRHLIAQLAIREMETAARILLSSSPFKQRNFPSSFHIEISS